TDIRGATGATGATGEKGDTGAAGADGEDGWSPEFAIVSDDERRVVQIVDWAGGTGTKPATGGYVGASGLVSDIAEASDIRGATGETGQAGPGIYWSSIATTTISGSPAEIVFDDLDCEEIMLIFEGITPSASSAVNV